MKLIIDISDHIYSMVTNTGTFGCYRFNTSKTIRQGIPLDKVRAEIKEEIEAYRMSDWETNNILADGLQMALNIIDGYRNEVTHKISKEDLETCPYDETGIL